VPWVSWGPGKNGRRVIIVLLFGLMLGFGGYAHAFEWCKGSIAIFSLAIGMLLVLGLLLDSFATFWHFFGFSTRNSLYFVCGVDSRFNTIVRNLKNTLRNSSPAVSPEELEGIVTNEIKKVMNEYQTRQPIRSILSFLLRRNASNLLLTIVAFSAMSSDVLILHKHWNLEGNPYKHECLSQANTSYGSLLWHDFYYHSVIFQSLGDGDHVPVSRASQVLATFEAYVAMSYLALLLGGSISVAVYAEQALTGPVIGTELYRAVLPIWTQRVPIKGPEDPRITKT
jgi:hypothetical protein